MPQDEGSGSPSSWAPSSPLAHGVDAAGFRYDPGQDIIYSRMNPAQREFGYAYAYDAQALAMSAVLDCEPIFFDYDDKTWMIEFWKGQYGLETGGEIGVYYRSHGLLSPLYQPLDLTIGRRPHDPAPSHSLFFECAEDRDRLEMSFVLYKNGQKLFSRGPLMHWWLTGFKWGLLSQPEDLTMEVTITCPSRKMCSAFVAGLRTTGHDDLNISGNTVELSFGQPRTFQPRWGQPEDMARVNGANRTSVNAYKSFGLPNNDPNGVGLGATRFILDSVSIYDPKFLRRVIIDQIQAARIRVPNPSLRLLAQRLNVS